MEVRFLQCAIGGIDVESSTSHGLNSDLLASSVSVSLSLSGVVVESLCATFASAFDELLLVVLAEDGEMVLFALVEQAVEVGEGGHRTQHITISEEPPRLTQCESETLL